MGTGHHSNNLSFSNNSTISCHETFHVKRFQAGDATVTSVWNALPEHLCTVADLQDIRKHSAYSESARRAAPGVRRRGAQDASGSVLSRRRSEWLSSRSVDVAVAVWHQFARYYTTGHFAQLFPPFDSLS